MTQKSPPEILIERTHQLFIKVTECSSKIFTDQTGCFPITSSRGYKYIVIAYYYDSNNILAEPINDEKRFTIYDKSTRQIVMQGHRDPNTTLYMINMTAPLKEMTEQHITETFRANHVYETRSKQELTLYYHAA